MNKERVQHDTNRGAALLIFVVFFLIASTVLVLGIGRGVYDDLVTYTALENGKQSFYAAEAGIEDAVYRHRDGRNYSNTETFSLNAATVNTTRTLVIDTYEVVASVSYASAVRSSKVVLSVGDGASFSFGLQSGNGGITLSNNSKIYGNVFSNGTVKGQGSATVYGEIISAGPSGRIETITATGSAWANAIVGPGTVIGGDAYYQSIAGATVSGAACVLANTHCHPGSPDQATATMPIPDTMIDSWKTSITASGTVISSSSAQCASGTYTIDTDTTLSNVKIECNVDIKKKGAGTTVTFAGPVWISGNLAFTSGPTIVASSSLGSKSVQVIVDNETNRATSSTISVYQSTDFNSGNAQSYVVLISMNNDAENGGTEVAIDLAQSANGKVLVYAPHGLVSMGNSISLKEVTGYKIDVNNGASVIYESGLMSLLFTGGPGGGFNIESWREIE